MAALDQAAVTRIFVNVGKSIAAFERTFRTSNSLIGGYVRGDTTALEGAQKDGLLAFLQAGCAQCHWGQRMTDDAFHVLRFPAGTLKNVDRGRMDGIPTYVASEFGAGSSWSDDPSAVRPALTAGPWTLGAFKTPSLRNVALTAPYGHGGNFVQIADVIELIRTGGMPGDSTLASGETEPWLPAFDPSASAPIAAFLSALAETFTH
jgi:cytochrome c peroxidase